MTTGSSVSGREGHPTGETIRLRLGSKDDGHAYVARPREGTGPGVVVVQEFWGVVDQIKGVADRLAMAGFTAVVPDLYDGAVTAEREEAMQLMLGLDIDEAVARLRHALAFARRSGADSDSGKVGCVGFCMGGGLALVLAASEPDLDAAVVYYGGIPWEIPDLHWDRSRAAVQMHYAGEDEWATPGFGGRIRQALREAGRPVEFHLYEGAKHAFLDETRPESHDPAATEESWARTVAFLRRRLSADDSSSRTEE